MSKLLKEFNKLVEVRRTVNPVLQRFSKAKYDEFGSHAYAAGYYEALIVDLMASVPKAKRELIITQLIGATSASEQNHS